MHDPLAVAVAIDESLVRIERMKLSITGHGQTVPWERGNQVDVCVEVDVHRFKDFLLSNITKF